MSRTFGNMVIRMAFDNQFSGRDQHAAGPCEGGDAARSSVAERRRPKVARGFTTK